MAGKKHELNGICSLFSYCFVMTFFFFVLGQVSIDAIEYHDQNTSWGGKGLFDLYFNIVVHH